MKSKRFYVQHIIVYIGGKMSHAYYSSGEKDENGDYILPEKATKTSPKVEIADMQSFKENLPKEFNWDYYDEKRDAYGRYANEFWEWVRLKTYAKSVLEMYNATAKSFCSIFNVEQSEYPSFVNFNVGSLSNAERNLLTAESDMVAQFTKAKHKVSAKIKKHAALRSLQNYGAIAWVSLFAINGKLPIKTTMAFQKTYEKLNLENELDLLRAFRGYKIVSRLIKYNVKQDLISNHHYAGNIYDNLDIGKIYDDLCNLVGTFDRADIEKIGSTIAPKIEKIYSKYGLLIDFYNDYEKIKYAIYRVKYISSQYYRGEAKTVNIFYNSQTSEDEFEVAKNHQGMCELLLSKIKSLPSIFVDEVSKMLEELNNALDYAKPAYESVND